MAEAIGAAASILQLIDLSGKVLCKGYGFLNSARNAPSRVRNLLSDVSAINLQLDCIRVLAEDQGKTFQSVLRELAARNVLQESQELLEKIQQQLERCEHVSKQNFQNFRRSIVWPWTEKEIDSSLQRLERLKSLLSEAVILDSASAIARIEKSSENLHQKVDNFVDEGDKAKLLTWICPADPLPEEIYDQSLRVRKFGTGAWLLKGVEFQHWRETPGSTLWVHGPPGSGKTILCTSVIEDLQTRDHDGPKAVAYFYFDCRKKSRQKTSDFLSCAILQLVQQMPVAMSHIAELKQAKSRHRMQTLSHSDYIGLLRAITSHLSAFYVVLDALDECDDLETLADYLDHSNFPNQMTFVSTRQDIKFRRVCSPFVTQEVPLGPEHIEEVEAYIDSEVESRLSRGRLKVRNRTHLPKLIKDTLKSQTDGLFLQAKLQLDIISNSKTDAAITAALGELPASLEETYERVLVRILDEFSHHLNEIKKMLHWLVGCTDYITTAMIAEAVAIKPGDCALDQSSIAPDSEDLISMLSSLVRVNIRHDASTVCLAHHSVEQYLTSSAIQRGRASYFAVNRAEAQRLIARTCLQYLSWHDWCGPIWPSSGGGAVRQSISVKDEDEEVLRQIEEFQKSPLPALPYDTSMRPTDRNPPVSPSTTTARFQQFFLLEYTSMNWFKHLKSSKYSEADFWSEVGPSIDWFLEMNDDRYKCWEEIYRTSRLQHYHRSGRQPSLFYALRFDLHHCIRWLAARQQHLNFHFPGGWTPLTLATQVKSSDTVFVLLEMGADANLAASRSRNSSTALHIAAEAGDAYLCSMLIIVGNASVHARTASGTTPFYRCIRAGHQSLAEGLHRADSEINVCTWDGHTPLIEAVTRNMESCAEWLLSAGADPLMKTINGDDALGIACLMQHRRIEELIRTHVDVSSRQQDVQRDGVSRVKSYSPTIHSQPDTILHKRNLSHGISTRSYPNRQSTLHAGLLIHTPRNSSNSDYEPLSDVTTKLGLLQVARDQTNMTSLTPLNPDEQRL